MGIRQSDRATTRRQTMKYALALLALLACMTAQASAEPWFYHGLEGPAFTTESNSTSGYEVRRYPRSFWTATTVTGKNMDKAGSEAFMRLFRYISGDNELKQKIEMTVPVWPRSFRGKVLSARRTSRTTSTFPPSSSRTLQSPTTRESRTSFSRLSPWPSRPTTDGATSRR